MKNTMNTLTYLPYLLSQTSANIFIAIINFPLNPLTVITPTILKQIFKKYFKLDLLQHSSYACTPTHTHCINTTMSLPFA